MTPKPSVNAGLTAKTGRAKRLVDRVGGGSAARRRPPVELKLVSPVAEPEPLRVLIVDDNPWYPELLLRLFHAQDWIEVVGCAVNGRDGVALASATKPDVVLMDINMPLLDGIEATRRILQRRRATVLVLTASVEPSEHQRALAAGARAVLDKAIDPMVLFAYLQDAYLPASGDPHGILTATPR
jgi:CheY-like chemotaxis protein